MGSKSGKIQTTFHDFMDAKRRSMKLGTESHHEENEMSLEEEYLEDCRARLSPHTVRSRETSLREFRKFLDGKPIEKATKLDVRKFLNDLKSRKRARSTIAHRLAAIRSFFDYARMYHNFDSPNLRDIRVREYPKSRWEGKGCVALERWEIRKLIEEASTLRDALIIALLYLAAGLRVCEVARLKIQDVDVKERVIKVIGKGNKPKEVPYPPILDRPIRRWLSRERKSYVNSDSPYFFPSKHGGRLSTKSIWRIVNRLAESAGIQKVLGKRGNGDKIYRISPHAFRRSFGTHAVGDEMSLQEVQRLMDHERLETFLTHYFKGSKKKIFRSYYDHFKGV